jgi:hypothetical protein
MSDTKPAWPPEMPLELDMDALIKQARYMADLHQNHFWAITMRLLADACEQKFRIPLQKR